MNALGVDADGLISEEMEAVERVIRSGWWILGEEVNRFEAEWAGYCGVSNAVGVASGMDALIVGLMALGVGPGDEVITTPMTAFATVLAIIRVGASPVLADIDKGNAMLTVESVDRCLSATTKAVILVHLYGQAGPVEELAALCRSQGIHLIEDCAQAHGAMASGSRLGTFGAFAAWSFYPTKNLGAIGDAGAISTVSPDLADRCRVLRNYGQSVRYVHTEYGLNSRLDEVHAAILRCRLRRLDSWNEARQRVAQRYRAGIAHPDVQMLPLPRDPERHVYHLLVVTSSRRDELQRHLAAAGVESLSHYPIPVHLQPPSSSVRRDPVGLAVSEAHARQCLSLPCHPSLTNEQVDFAVSVINSFSIEPR